MTPDRILEAAALIEQYNMIKKFLDESPDNPESVTLTLRKSTNSNSITLRPYPLPNFDLIEIIERLETETLAELKKLGVDVDEW